MDVVEIVDSKPTEQLLSEEEQATLPEEVRRLYLQLITQPADANLKTLIDLPVAKTSLPHCNQKIVQGEESTVSNYFRLLVL